ncbi:UxaA family hydrolase [Granulosicoccus sp. 3-233]|uniref:UxaA family hydrolase n=1 Tax=Granulosicoccus sp. 3-233 TaxID=3417969 RepID=UPI003D34A818
MSEATESRFMGYSRKTGRPGVRNHLLILNATGLTEPTARRLQGMLPGAVLASTSYGMGLIGFDAQRQLQTLIGLASNPNVGAVLLLSADRLRTESLVTALRSCGKEVEAVSYQDVAHDALRMTDEAFRRGAALLQGISRQRRTPQPLSELVVGMECGLSDPTSGIAANPLIGRISDRLVEQGASVIVGETLEWLGTEVELARRGVDQQTSEAVSAAVLRREAMAREAGISLIDINPNRANIEAGLSTIEEKASGSVAKSGTSPVQGVLQYSEAPAGRGLYLMDAPAYTPESLTGFVAAGAQLLLFSTGIGNSYVSALAPTLKLSANEDTVSQLPQQIDLDCSSLIAGTSTMKASVDMSLQSLLDIASGTLTWGEVVGEGGESISRFGESL